MSIEFSTLYDSLPVGWLDKEEALLLYEYARRTTGDILEVGSFRGRSAALLGTLGRTVHCVDPFDGFDDQFTGDQLEEVFLENMAYRGLDNVVLYRMKVEDWEPDSRRNYGFVYLDGDHTYEGTVVQVEKALACKPQIIAMHDVNDTGDGEGIKRAAVERLGQYHIRAGKMAIWLR